MTHPQLINTRIYEYLRYFGDKGMAPKIVWHQDLPSFEMPVAAGIYLIENTLVNYEHVSGDRLSVLLADGGEEKLVPILHRLGYCIGHITKYGIVHGHLHTDNIVAGQDGPVIIDWGMATLDPYGLNRNLEDFLKSADLRTARLLDAFTDSYIEEMAAPLSPNHDEIYLRYNPFLSKWTWAGFVH